MESIFTYKFRLDTRREFADGTYPIKVNIHNRKTNINRDKSFYSRANRLRATKKDFETIWTDRFKYNSFGEITGGWVLKKWFFLVGVVWIGYVT